MISLDTRLQGEALVLRPSMIKFDATNKTDIEICESAYRPLPAYLNRQFIKILEDMGVDDSFFLTLQKKEVDRLRMIVSSPISWNVCSFSAGPQVIYSLKNLGSRHSRDNVLTPISSTLDILTPRS